MTRIRSLVALGLLLASTASAQPVTRPEDAPQLAELRDDKQLAEALSAITQDPAVHVDDPHARSEAQALMTEGVHQLQLRAFDQALANFLEAYAKFPSPKILLDIASTLRDMGRPADAANTYNRYLADPATGAERVGEVKQLLLQLDKRLTVLAVRVFPRGSQVSIDGGPFIAVGSTLLTRVRPGLHLVRVRQGTATSEATINAFEGEEKEVPVAVKIEVGDTASPLATTPTTPPPRTGTPATASTPPAHPALGDKLPIETTLPDRVEGWLITGTQYASDSGTGRSRRVRAGYAGPEVAPIIPTTVTQPTDQIVASAEPTPHINSGAIALTRIVPFGNGTGAAIGLGFAYTPIDRVELLLEVLRSQAWGAYLGGRYRLLVGDLRPYVGGGVPLFEFTDGVSNSTAVSLGVRAEGGVEYRVQAHLSIAADLGIEHYFSVSNKLYMNKTPDATLFAPTIAVVGRM